MDTRFWGPSGWKLLHLIAAEPFADSKHRVAVTEWIGLLEYVLPCKYCRASFHDYLRLQPLTDKVLSSPALFGRWIYDIHNRVNGKLRGQGLLTDADPSWDEIREHYRELHSGLCVSSPLLGWDFMISVAFTTPAADYVPTPMPDTPDYLETGRNLTTAPEDPATRNRYNLLTREERLPYLARWWALLPSVLPCAAWRRAWNQALRQVGQPPLDAGRETVLRWMWRVEADVCHSLRCEKPHGCLLDLKREVVAFESSCGRSKKGKTCRTRRKAQRRQVRTRRARKGVVVL
jgi:hypothetical protein